MSGIKIYVLAHVGDQEIKISVGDGKQSFKWLAQEIQNRKNNTILVSEVKNIHGELLNPADKICEHSSSNTLHVSVNFSQAFPINDFGDPVYTDWMQAAYIKSEHGERWQAEERRWLSHDSQAVRLESTRGNDLNNLILIGEFSENEAEAAFNLDWDENTYSADAKNYSSMAALKSVLKKYYPLLCSIFVYICGRGVVGQRYGMSVREFEHFAHYTGLINCSVESPIIEHVFRSSLRSAASAHPESKAGKRVPGDRSNTHSLVPLMSRREFVAGLLNANLYLLTQGSDRERDPETDSSRPGTSQSSAQMNWESPKLVVCMEEFLKNQVLKYWQGISAGSPMFNNSVASVGQNLCNMVYSSYSDVKGIFTTICKNTSFTGAVTTLEDIQVLFEDCCLYDPLSAAHVDAFKVSAEKAQPIPIRFGNSKKLSDWCFCEFLDLFVRFSLLTIAKNSEVERLRLAIDFLEEYRSQNNFAHK